VDLTTGKQVSIKTSKRIAAVTLALLAAAQLAGCSSSSSSPGTTPTDNTGGGTGGGGTGGGGTGGGGTGGDTGGGGTGGDTGGGTGGGDTGGDGGGTGGDGGGTGGDGGGTTPPGELTAGVFVDAPVAGLSYTTSSGLSGLTDATGRYEYRVGDTVTFSIGDLVLGTVAGQELVTPTTVATAIAAGSGSTPETVTVNLLVLLQSLDVDGDPENGITLTTAITNAVAANSIDLTAAEASFTSSLNTFVSNVSGSSGVTLTPADREDALAHFVAQGPAAVAGFYVRADASFAPITQNIVTLTMFRSGRYLLGGQHNQAGCNLNEGQTAINEQVFSDANGNGVEYGTYSWDPLTKDFAVSNVSMETDGYCGFNEPVTGAQNDITKLEPTTNGIELKDAGGNVIYRFVRAQRENTGLAGGWLQPSALMAGEPFTLTLFPSSEDGRSGRFLAVDAMPADAQFDTTPGIEEGCYSVDAQNNLSVELDSAECPNAIDTNNTAGVSSFTTGQMFVDVNDRLVISDGNDWTGFTRLPLVALTHEAMAGSWLMQATRDGSTPLQDQEQLHSLTVFEDGRFLFGTQENNAACTATYPTPNQEADGNGLEYGTLSLTLGLVVPVVTADTNGECGLFDATAAIQQRYFIAPNAEGDALVVWANDEEDPSGFVFKRAPSSEDGLIGAWLWDSESQDEISVTVFLPGDVLFETRHSPGESGILREKYSISAEGLTAINDTYEFCVDTADEPSSCLPHDAEVPAPFSVVEDTLTYDGSTATRIAP
jgi:hypothetical protein